MLSVKCFTKGITQAGWEIIGKPICRVPQIGSEFVTYVRIKLVTDVMCRIASVGHVIAAVSCEIERTRNSLETPLVLNDLMRTQRVLEIPPEVEVLAFITIHGRRTMVRDSGRRFEDYRHAGCVELQG